MTRYSSVRKRRLHPAEAAAERFVASRVGAWLYLHVFHRVDERLVPLSRGRLSVTVGAPVGLLDAVGARTATPRRIPLLYGTDGDRVVVVASNGGGASHPAWYHNVRANPDVRFLTRDGVRREYRARVAHGDERARLWLLVTDLYGGYEHYQRRAGGRRVPVVVLEPADPAPGPRNPPAAPVAA